MTKYLYLATLTCLFCLPALAQDIAATDFNLDYENTSQGANLPEATVVWGKDYRIETDTTVAKSGKKSVLIQKVTDDAQFGCIATSIPAIYEGKTIVLTGWLKLENVTDGNAGLIMRIDGDYKMLQFDNMNQQQINGTANWKEYKIELPLPTEARTIFVGAINSGTGKLWVDNLSITIDGKDFKKAKIRQTLLPLAQQDKEFDNGSLITSITLTPQKIQDLKVLGLVWGYLKYYHPAIATGNHNWDYELFRILPKILNAKNTANRDAALLDWAKALGPFEKSNPKKTQNVKLSPDLDWITTLGLSEELSELLNDLKNAKRTDNHYYIGLNPDAHNPNFKNENPYYRMNFSDAGYRLLGLYRYWNMIQYYFPNRHLIGEDWKSVLEEFIPKYVNAQNETEYKLATLEIIGRINDTHADLYGNKTIEEIRGNRFAADMVRFVEGKPVVYGNMGKTTAQSLKNGDVITAVNGKPVEDIINERLKYTPASNMPTKLRNIGEGLLRSNNSTIDVSYLRNGTPHTKTIATYNTADVDLHKYFATNDTCFKMLTPKVAYMYAGSIKGEYIDAFFKDIKNTDGLIIDLRCYPNDVIVFNVSQMFAKGKIEFVKWSKPSITTPGEFTVEDYSKLKGKGRYKGKVVVLINETTQSQAEYTAMTYRAAGATIIGSTTAGADGNISAITLPGDINTVISGLGVYYPDGTETQRVGIIPDVEVKPTLKGIAEGRDEVLEKAIDFINKK
jgi:C-terminal processing protease CtpA/Prc